MDQLLEHSLVPQPKHIGRSRETVPDSDGRSCPGLGDVLVEIILLIFQRLPLVSQVCRTLTCKSFYRLCDSILEDEKLAWPQLLASKSYEIPLSQPSLLRNRLLFKLEDERWLDCSGCLKLHPRAFSLQDGCMPPAPRRCIHPANVVDLCSCLALTFFDRLKLGEWLRTGHIDPTTLPRSIRQSFSLSNTESQRYLVHQCRITDYFDTFVDITMKITLSEFDTLLMATRYKIHMRTPRPPPRDLLRELRKPPSPWLETIFLCPRYDLISDLLDPYDPDDDISAECRTTAHIIGHTDDRAQVVVQALRDLGGVAAQWWPEWNLSARSHLNQYMRPWYRLGCEEL